MDTRIGPGISRVDVAVTDSASRVTPVVGVPFHEMINSGANALLRGAQAAITSLPGAPIVAAAVRPGGGSLASVGGPLTAGGSLTTGGGASSVLRAPAALAVQGSAESPTSSVSGGSSSTTESSSVEGALAQSQEFNLYYLQLQEQLAAENRSYSAMSNVLKARHDTVKNAIGNIR